MAKKYKVKNPGQGKKYAQTKFLGTAKINGQVVALVFGTRYAGRVEVPVK